MWRPALDLRVERILLDNMTPDMMRAAVDLTAGRAKLEASGNVTLDNVRQVAETGVDYISIGALTHSAKVLDVSFDLERMRPTDVDGDGKPSRGKSPLGCPSSR